MSGACSMQELKYFRDGATLVISLEDLNWRSKRRCSDKRIKKRNEELQLLISSGQMIPADEELQAITCFLDQRGSAAPQLWSTTDSRSGMVAWPPPSSISPRQCCLPEEPAHDSALISVASVVSDTPQEGPWTRLILNTQEICSLIKINLNISTQPNTVTVNQHNRFITFCDEDIPLQRFGDIGYTEDCRTFIGSSGYNNNVLGDLKYSTALSPNTNNSNGNQHELVIRDNLNNLKSRLKSCQIYDAPGILSRRDVNVKKRKSVSFDSEVMVYLFDQESPTVELHTEASTSLPDVTLEDSGTILKDDTNDFAHFIPYCVC